MNNIGNRSERIVSFKINSKIEFIIDGTRERIYFNESFLILIGRIKGLMISFDQNEVENILAMKLYRSNLVFDYRCTLSHNYYD